jgi:hypothetical protein
MHTHTAPHMQTGQQAPHAHYLSNAFFHVSPSTRAACAIGAPTAASQLGTVPLHKPHAQALHTAGGTCTLGSSVDLRASHTTHTLADKHLRTHTRPLPTQAPPQLRLMGCACGLQPSSRCCHQVPVASTPQVPTRQQQTRHMSLAWECSQQKRTRQQAPPSAPHTHTAGIQWFIVIHDCVHT